MTESTPRSYTVEAIIESPAMADERLQTVEGVRAEITSAVAYLGATVAMMAVRELTESDDNEGGRR